MATKLVIYLLFFGLYTVQIGGQMNSDPAPGRSPGPPGGIRTIDDDVHGSSGSIKSTTLLLTKDPTEVDDDNENDDSDAPEYSNDSELSKLNEIKPNEGDDEDEYAHLLLDVDERMPHPDGINLHRDSGSGSATGGVIRSRDSDTGAGGGGGNSGSKPCGNEFSDFLNDVIVIDEDEVGNEKNSTIAREQLAAEARNVDIQLEVIHDIFNTKEELNCGLLYRVRVTSSLKDGSSVAGDFFVETVSSSSGKERGHFVDHSSGNKWPISWMKTPQNVGGDVNWASEDSRSDNTFNNGDQVTANTFQPFGTQWTDDDERNFVNENGDESADTKCPGENTWHGRNGPYADAASTTTNGGSKSESQNLWILNEFCHQAEMVDFRIFFRPTKKISTSSISGGIAPALQVVHKKTISFKIAKDCQLILKTLSGTLDYTALPLYSIDCTVHFPSFQMANLGQLPPGILVELTRLNVPCNSGGYLKFTNRSQLCGKLEELNLNERTYHFDVLQNSSVKIYKNPMFSLNYKLVDFCYNVSSSNESGQFYVRPTRRDSLECYFRIHLPYGNRIQLQLVTNNESDVVNSNPSMGAPSLTISTSSDSTPAASPAAMMTTTTATTTTTQTTANDATTIYTSLGLSIETNIVNLSLSANDDFVKRTATTTTSHHRVGTLGTPLDTSTRDFVFGSSSSSSRSSSSSSNFAPDSTPLGSSRTECHGVVIKIFENEFAKWSHCVNSSSEVSGFFVESSGNTLSIHLIRPVRLKNSGRVEGTPSVIFHSEPDDDSGLSQLPSIFLSYVAKPIPEIVSNCAFGWIALQQFCVTAIEMAQSWHDGEQHCMSLGGHLASIRSELEQSIIDNLLVNSPGYHDRFAYWVGGSDKNFEGDFRWTDGLPFQYANWFPGWSQHGHYNKQPNDDGLSSQDCIELRRYFRTPPGIQSTRNPLANNFMWNDRDCNANNFVICERPMSDETFRKNWINDCNKTVSLTKEHPRASVWSPSFPRQYPDNANCFVTITAPSGYRIVLEFEELVIENEPGCTYDYLEITEPTASGSAQHLGNFNIESRFMKSSRHNKFKTTPFANNILNTNTNRDFQKRSSYDNPSLSYTSSYVNANSYNNFNIAQTNYQNLLNIFSNLYKPHVNFLIQTPDYPKGNPYYPTGKGTRTEALPKRLCGDWSSKLKLLRHISSGSYLGLHFVSDYSHHFGGFKAKAFMENSASECTNERLRPYNGSCYLFVSYPEADWWTAQQVCRGMGAKLSSVSSSDEHRFITANIRNHIDYSPQLIYWLGAELEKSGQFEWTDDTKMNFQGWLPGQGQFEEIPRDSTCLGLQWKMSPTPMLPSGLYWQSQKCNKVGGYVCKKPKESFGQYALNNSTITGKEGRLVSPAYPNTYPHNIDYWIHIRAPERTRIIVQFQKIDLEAQDECLYDFISIQNYELVSKISLEPGTNPIPMAMLTNEREFNEVQYESNHNNPYAKRTKRSLRQQLKDTSSTSSNSTSGSIPDENLMNHSEMQMSSARGSVASAADIRQHGLQEDDSKNLNVAYDGNSKIKHPPPPPSLSFQSARHYANKVQLNPKRRRRKNYPSEIANKFSQQRHHQRQGQQHHQYHQMYHHLSKRSTILRSIPLADNAQSFLPYVRWCGSHDSNMSKFDFVSSSNQVVLNFHSDYSVTGLGFAAVWKAIDMSGCPMQTLTSREGTVVSPNYPHFLLNNLNCAYVIQAPMGRRVWLEFVEYDLTSDSLLEVDIGSGYFRPFRIQNHVNEGIFVSMREQIRVQLRTGQRPQGRGFQAIFHTVGQTEKDRVINLTNNFTGYLFQLNYPHGPPENVDFTQHLVAPFGDNILLELHGVEFGDNGCPDNNIIEIYDNYADNNGTKWQLCKFQNLTRLSDEQFGNKQYQQLHHQDYTIEPQLAPVYITSYLNTLHIRQRTTSKSDINLNGTVRIQQDNNYKLKLASGDNTVESCHLNPCQFNGKCVANNGKSHCQCQGHYTGRFCGLNSCELEPCIFGKCELTATNFKCHCQPGYQGSTCEQKQRPCAENPCEGRGTCFEKNGGYFCRCHAWWEGHRCERRMMHIPYKPLSERMLQEPFWLGLITVFVVLAVIGLVWCAKRHFPEKIEKLLAEEADRNRPPGSIHGHHHHTSLREQLQFTTAIPQTTTNIAPGAPRSIFNRLGIRKPSLLSLSSPNPTGGGATARTFSLDDLLRPPPRRSPSPRKKRNNSTPVRKNAAEKKQILQQLVSPAANPPKPKVSLGELIQMSENRLRASNADSESGDKETTFSENSGSAASSSATAAVARAINDPKLEKKVTFARLLNKVSAEMSSGSEMDVGHGTQNSSALSLPAEIQFRANSMPPSPCTNDIRSPHSTSSNPGSDSMSSSDLALTDFGLCSIQIQTNRNRARPKVSSADSILAMFRNFASTTTTASNTNTPAMPSNSSMFVSPSTTPTASSPQDDAAGDDESSTSSMHTPISFSSGAPDSPVFYRQTTIEVPVLDALNAHKSNATNSNLLHPPTILLEIPSNGINKCLSPIREMPTPIPSPALTPIMPRPQRSNSPIFQDDQLSVSFSDDSDRSSDNQISASIFLDLGQNEKFMRRMNRRDSESDYTTTSSSKTNTTSMADIHNQFKFKCRSSQSMSPPPVSNQTNQGKSPALLLPNIIIDVEPPTPEEKAPRPRDLIIPTLTVEQPSPTKNRFPMIIFPGSPPPQRASIGETSFMFPNKQQQKRLLKQFEKPTSLDLPFEPPMITVTSNMSELESDTEPLSPAPKVNVSGSLLAPGNPVGMCYLSPFTMCSRADRTISESNLSSSGYSSMASPGPSRCGSSNPLCPNEMDEPGSGHSGPSLSLHASLLSRRKNAALASCKENISNGKSGAANDENLERLRTRSDSETLSDDILLESNDEGIGTDHVDEKMDDARTIGNRNCRELGAFIEEQVLIEVDEPPPAPVAQMAQLQLPSIIIQVDGAEKGLSPVSSRSESPLSERAGMGRFSPHFYGRKDQLPFTDSDGLYDFPSSDGKASSYTHQRRSSSKKRERKLSKTNITQSPTKSQLDVPTKDSNNTPTTSSHVCSKHCRSHHHSCPAQAVSARKSPKRRPINRHPVATSSSSSESLTSTKDLTVRSMPRRLNSPNREKRQRKHDSNSEEEATDALLRRISPSIVTEDQTRPRCKINRLRAIGNQIRFLRRLEKSIKTRERLVSPSDSCAEENTDDLDSPQATSPLLQPPSPSRTKVALCRQKRLPTGSYSLSSAAALNPGNWKNRERNIITADDINSD